ncbi:MAG: cyclic nucleotide-binding domain-containing protein, partial [Actinomycetota bacterium]
MGEIDALGYLKASATFGDLSDPVLKRLHACLVPFTVVAGDVLIEEGEPPGDAYIVAAGRLVASTLDSEGKSIVVGEIGEGDLVGEMSLLTRSARTATVTAIRDCTVLRMSAEDFSQIIIEEPLALFDVTRTVVRRLDHLIHDRRPGSAIGVVAVIPCGSGVLERPFVDDLADMLSSHVRTAIVDQERVTVELGDEPTNDG